MRARELLSWLEYFPLHSKGFTSVYFFKSRSHFFYQTRLESTGTSSGPDLGPDLIPDLGPKLALSLTKTEGFFILVAICVMMISYVMLHCYPQ